MTFLKSVFVTGLTAIGGVGGFYVAGLVGIGYGMFLGSLVGTAFVYLLKVPEVVNAVANGIASKFLSFFGIKFWIKFR